MEGGRGRGLERVERKRDRERREGEEEAEAEAEGKAEGEGGRERARESGIDTVNNITIIAIGNRRLSHPANPSHLGSAAPLHATYETGLLAHAQP